MKIFNVGALELVFILLLAFIVLGPEKAIKAAGDMARWIKGLTSGETFELLEAYVNCAQNSLLFIVRPNRARAREGCSMRRSC